MPQSLADLFIFGVAPIDYCPIVLLKPFGFRIAPDTLSSEEPRERWLQIRLGCLRLSPSCPCRLLHTFLPLHGQRGVTPAFGHSAPHPGAGGTLTLLTHALLSAHHEPLRLPRAPRSVHHGHPVGHPCPRLGVSRVAYAFLVYMLSPLPRRSGRAYCFAHSPQPYQPSPKGLSGRPAHRPFRGLLGVHSRCGLHTRAVTVYRDTLTRGSSHFVTSMTCPVASGWSGCRITYTHWRRPLCTAHTRCRPRAASFKFEHLLA